MSNRRLEVREVPDALVATEYRQSVERRLDRTGAIMQDLRQRAGTLVAASGVISGLFGQRVLGDPDGAVAWVAIGFALLMLAAGLWNCLWILAPVKDTGKAPSIKWPNRRRLRFYFAPYLRFGRPREWKMGLTESEFWGIAQADPEESDASVIDSNVSPNRTGDTAAAPFDLRLARKLEHARQLNILTIEKRSRWFEGACGLLLAQIAFWIVATVQ